MPVTCHFCFTSRRGDLFYLECYSRGRCEKCRLCLLTSAFQVDDDDKGLMKRKAQSAVSHGSFFFFFLVKEKNFIQGQCVSAAAF